MRNVHTKIWPFALATRPETEATTWVLQLGEALDVGIEGCVHRGIRWHIWSLERHQNIPQRNGADHTASDLLRTRKWILMEVNRRIRELTQRRTGGRDIQATLVQADIFRKLNSLPNRSGIHNAIGCKRLAACRCVDRNRDGLCIRVAARNDCHLEACCPGLDRLGREAHFHPVSGWDRDTPATPLCKCRVHSAYSDIHCHRLLGLILNHNRQLKLITHVEEAWG